MPDIKEINEAREAAREALHLLCEVEKRLRSARNWGIYDILGGGFFSSLIKHSKVDQAESLLRDVQNSLYRLQKELKDIDLSLNTSVGITEFEKFLDIAFDNILSDWFTQSRINESLQEVSRLKSDVQGVIYTLDKLK
ncbi:MAG: hypothetical protein PHD88_06770 [Firmicutes bacterium]|nr:hypothetical protein [Bacillota bacterium]